MSSFFIQNFSSMRRRKRGKGSRRLDSREQSFEGDCVRKRREKKQRGGTKRRKRKQRKVCVCLVMASIAYSFCHLLYCSSSIPRLLRKKEKKSRHAKHAYTQEPGNKTI